MLTKSYNSQNIYALILLIIITTITSYITYTYLLYTEKIELEPTFPNDKCIKTPKEILKEMGPGICIGNSLEAQFGETFWGNPYITQKIIDGFMSRGIKAFRIPIRWDDKLIDEKRYVINPIFLKRIQQVINYIYNKGGYVIINTHHSKYERNIAKDIKNNKIRLTTYWKQISEYFISYGDRLIFELWNEPVENSNWCGFEEFSLLVNEYNELMLETIRKTGGNNIKRLIIIPPYAGNGNLVSIVNFKFPTYDKFTAASIHMYRPSGFVDGKLKELTIQRQSDMFFVFRIIKEYLYDKDIPIIISEFGVKDYNNLNERIKFVKIVSKFSHALGAPCFYWDDGIKFFKKTFGIYNRYKNYWVYPEINDILIEEYNREPSKIEDLPFYENITSNPYFITNQTLDTFKYKPKPFIKTFPLVIMYGCEYATFNPYWFHPKGILSFEFKTNQYAFNQLFIETVQNHTFFNIHFNIEKMNNGHYLGKLNYNDMINQYDNVLDYRYIRFYSNDTNAVVYNCTYTIL